MGFGEALEADQTGAEGATEDAPEADLPRLRADHREGADRLRNQAALLPDGPRSTIWAQPCAWVDANWWGSKRHFAGTKQSTSLSSGEPPGER